MIVFLGFLHSFHCFSTYPCFQLLPPPFSIFIYLNNKQQHFCRKERGQKKSRYSRKKVWNIHRRAFLLSLTATLRVLGSKSLVLTPLKVHYSYYYSCVPSVHIPLSESQLCSVRQRFCVFKLFKFCYMI